MFRSLPLCVVLLAAPASAEPRLLTDDLVLQQWTVDDGLSINHINALTLGGDGRLWLATFDGLWSFDGRGFESVGIGGPDGVHSPRVTDIARHAPSDTLYVAFEDGTLQRRSPGGVELLEPLGPVGTTLVEGPRGIWGFAGGDVIHRLEEEPRVVGRVGQRLGAVQGDREGALWVRSLADEWLPWSPETGAGERVPAAPHRGRGAWEFDDTDVLLNGVPVLRADHMILDVQPVGESVFVATRGSGLLRLRPPSVRVLGPPAGVVPRVERLWWEDATQTLWARSGDKAWWAVDPPHTLLHPPGLNDPAPGAREIPWDSLPFSVDGRGRWWATQGRVVREDPETGTLHEVEGSPRFWAGTESFRSRDGALWISLQGVYRVDGDVWEPVRAPDGSDLAARTFASLPDGSVVLGALGGVAWVSRDRDEVRAAIPRDQPAARHLRVTGDRLWIASEDRGLCVVPVSALPAALTAGPDWRCLRADAGLGSDGVHASLPDGLGRIWVSANRGIGWADAADLEGFADGRRDRVEFVWLDTADGMRSAEANGAVGGAVHRTSDGSLWFPTQDGVARVRPREIAAPPRPRARIRDVEIDGLPASPDGLRALAPSSFVRLRWSAAELQRPDALRFRHRLDGGPWSAPRIDDHVLLRGLSPGPHRFEVRASTGPVEGPTASIELVRPPTLTERSSVRLGAVGAGFALVVMGAALRLRAARRRREELEERIAEATEQLRTRAEELRALAEHSSQQAARLTELDRIKRRLLANVSHELRTPIALIVGPLGTLKLRTAQEREAVGLALRNAERLQGLVGQLLDVARAQSGTLRLRARRGPLGRRVAAILERFSGAGGGAVRLLPPDPDPDVWCDPEMLDTMLGNLIANAREHGAGDVEVSVAVEDGGAPRAVVRVRDHGPGVAPEERGRVFERFRQEGAGAGLGLGLALVRELAELHGGDVGVDPADDGPGAVFWFTLPLGADHLDLADVDVSSPPEPASEPVWSPPSPADGRPVLLVEDNLELRAFLASQLADRFAVTAVETAEEGLETLGRTPFALVITDIMLPGMSGLDLARSIRDAGSDVPVLVISARGDMDSRVDGLNVADDYLAKPFQIRELVARCEALLRRAGPAEEVQAPPALPEAAQGLLDALDRLAEERLSDPTLDVDALAAGVGMSRRSLHDKLRALGLPSPGAWLRERRLDRAEELLTRGTFETVGEVAAAVGLSRAYFTRAFKARFGAPPGARLRRS